MNLESSIDINPDANADTNEIDTDESSATSDDLDEDYVESNCSSEDQNVMQNNDNQQAPTISIIHKSIDVEEEDDFITQLQIMSSNVDSEGQCWCRNSKI